MLTRAAGRCIVKISSVPCAPLRSRIRCGALQPSLSEQCCSSFNNQVDRLRHLIARPPRRLQVTRIIVGVTPTSALQTHWRAGITPARSSAHPAQRIGCSCSRGAAMEFVEHEDDRPKLISIFRCRELLAEEAESMTDEEVALIRRHAETMACIVVEMSQKAVGFPVETCVGNATCRSARMDLRCQPWSAR